MSSDFDAYLIPVDSKAARSPYQPGPRKACRQANRRRRGVVEVPNFRALDVKTLSPVQDVSPRSSEVSHTSSPVLQRISNGEELQRAFNSIWKQKTDDDLSDSESEQTYSVSPRSLVWPISNMEDSGAHGAGSTYSVETPSPRCSSPESPNGFCPRRESPRFDNSSNSSFTDDLQFNPSDEDFINSGLPEEKSFSFRNRGSEAVTDAVGIPTTDCESEHLAPYIRLSRVASPQPLRKARSPGRSPYRLSPRVSSASPPPGSALEVENIELSKKRRKVSFNDECGMALAEVHVLEESDKDFIENLSMSLQSLSFDPSCASSQKLFLNFDPPTTKFKALMQRVERTNVVLENVFTREVELMGTIKVTNLAFNKEVFIRITADRWKSYTDVPTTYMRQASGELDTFAFRINMASATTPAMGDIQFAVCYRVASQEFWDNNGGENFGLVILGGRQEEEIGG